MVFHMVWYHTRAYNHSFKQNNTNLHAFINQTPTDFSLHSVHCVPSLLFLSSLYKVLLTPTKTHSCLFLLLPALHLQYSVFLVSIQSHTSIALMAHFTSSGFLCLFRCLHFIFWGVPFYVVHYL